MQLGQKAARKSSEENIIPLINVVFLLLIFFLLAGTLAPKPPFELEAVPAGESPAANVPEGALYISGAGALFYQGSMMQPSSLAEAVKREHQSSEPLEVLVDRRLKAEKLFPVVETLGKAGITKVRLLTQRRGR